MEELSAYTKAQNARLTRLMVISHTYVEPANRGKWFALRKLTPTIDAIVVTPTVWLDPEFGWRTSAPDSMVRLRFVPMNIWGSGYCGRYIFVDPALLSLISQFRPDIIQVEAEPWSLVYIQMAVLRRLIAPRAKMLYFSWWNSPEWKTPLHFPGSLAYKIGRHATHLVIAGNHGAAELHRQHGYAGPIVVIPQLGVTVEEYYPCLPDPELISRYALESSFVIGFIGRLTWRKGIETLLEAVAELRNGSWKLLLVGDGPQRDELIGKAVALGISERVVITGAIPRQQIPNYIRIMNLLVLPSSKEQWEQFGHVLVEAMACGVPVVGSSSGEIPYVIGNEELVFPIGDSVSLRKKITRVMKEPGFAAECRLQGIRRVQDNYSDEAIARQLYTAYQRLGSISNLAPAKVDPVKCL